MTDLGNCPRKLQFCPRCVVHGRNLGCLVPNPVGDLYEGHWCKTLRCPSCKLEWHVCTKCSSSQKHIVDSTMLRRHYKLYHQVSYKAGVQGTRVLGTREQWRNQLKVEQRRTNKNCIAGTWPVQSLGPPSTVPARLRPCCIGHLASFVPSYYQQPPATSSYHIYYSCQLPTFP